MLSLKWRNLTYPCWADVSSILDIQIGQRAWYSTLTFMCKIVSFKCEKQNVMLKTWPYVGIRVALSVWLNVLIITSYLSAPYYVCVRLFCIVLCSCDAFPHVLCSCETKLLNVRHSMTVMFISFYNNPAPPCICEVWYFINM